MAEAVLAYRCRDPDATVDRGWKDEATGVIGMFSDKVDTPGSPSHPGGFLAELLPEKLLNRVNLIHPASFPPWDGGSQGLKLVCG